MKQRVISALIGLVILLVVLLFYEGIVFNIAIAAISAIAVYEILHSTGYVKNLFVLVCSVLYGASIPLYDTASAIGSSRVFLLITLLYLALLLGALLVRHQTLHFTAITTAVFVSLLVPLAFSILIYIRDHSGYGLFYTLLACVAAWVADSAAYFVGRKFGKHKMCPLISPHKTIEGAFGGVFFAMLFFVLFCWGYSLILRNNGVMVHVSYGAAVLNGILCSLAGIAGDLLASVIKRQTGIKDFGTIMPGHGGIMDRFDSFLLVVPVLYLLLQAFPILTVIS